jgi:hypothetical protein
LSPCTVASSWHASAALSSDGVAHLIVESDDAAIHCRCALRMYVTCEDDSMISCERNQHPASTRIINRACARIVSKHPIYNLIISKHLNHPTTVSWEESTRSQSQHM